MPPNPLETFNYDPVGNRTNSNQNGSSTFNQANQLLEDASFTYQYDNNGNVTQKTAKVGGAVTQFEYDAENKLVRIVSPSNTANYRYDGLGRRVEKEVIAGTTATTRYVYDNDDILLELNGSNTIVARYTHGLGIDEPLIMEKNSQSFYYHADGLGSIAEMTNQSGSVAQRYSYSSFGKIESQLDANFVQPYTFTSREFDTETGLYYYRARYYDPSQGRFLREDPVLRAGSPDTPYLLPRLVGKPQDLNSHVYVASNPINFVDAFGWQEQSSNQCSMEPKPTSPPPDTSCQKSIGQCYSDCVHTLLIDPLKYAAGLGLAGAVYGIGSVPGPGKGILNVGQYTGATAAVYLIPKLLGITDVLALARAGALTGGAMVAGAGVVAAVGAGAALGIEAGCLASCIFDACSY